MSREQIEGSYFSVSRVKLFEKCRAAYKFKYIDKFQESVSEPLIFGKLVHRVLELIFEWAIREEFYGMISDQVELVNQFYDQAFSESVCGYGLYQEGLSLVRNYFKCNPRIDSLKIIDTEKKFDLEIGGHRFIGYIDRIDKIGDDSIEVVDYKTNRVLFSEEEMENDIQVGVYIIAIRKLFPWIQNVSFSFSMLRHNVDLKTHRSEEQLSDFERYLSITLKEIENCKEYPCSINKLCCWCGYSKYCEEYNKIANSPPELLINNQIDTRNMENVSILYERACSLAKIAKNIESEMEEIIIENIKNLDPCESDEIKFSQFKYKLVNGFYYNYPLHKTVDVVVGATGMTREQAIREIASVVKSRVDKIAIDLNFSPHKTKQFKEALRQIAIKQPKKAYLSSSRNK